MARTMIAQREGPRSRRHMLQSRARWTVECCDRWRLRRRRHLSLRMRRAAHALIVVRHAVLDIVLITVRPCVNGRLWQAVTCHSRGLLSSAEERYKLQRPDPVGLWTAPVGGDVSVVPGFVAPSAAAPGSDIHCNARMLCDSTTEVDPTSLRPQDLHQYHVCLLYTSPSPRDRG